MTKTLDIAKRLIEIDSITPNDNGCINIIKSELNNLNFEYQSIDSNGVSNLYAKRGESSPSIIFAGHVDVVPPGPLDKWQSDPFIPTAKDHFATYLMVQGGQHLH